MPSSKSKKPVPAQASSASRPAPAWLIPAALALAFVFLVGLFSTELSDTDSWWHLATGKYIVQQHRLPYPDPFAYTTAMAQPSYTGEAATQRFNLTHEWLAQVAMYIADAVGGIPAVALWKALLLALACALTGHVTRVRTGSYWWGVAAMLAASPVLVVFAHDRPGILSYVFSIAFIAILEDRRRLWLLPALALIWANCHGGFFLGWVICGAYCAGAFLRREKDWKRVAAFSAAAVLLSGLNPNGFSVVTTLASYRRSPMTATLMEWSRPGFWGEPVTFFVLLYLAAAVLALSWRKVRISDWLLFLAFAGASLSAFRNLPLMALFAPILIAAYWPGKRTGGKIAGITRRLPACMTLALVGGIVWGVVSGNFFQLRAAEWRFPQGAASFLLERAPGARVFNTYEDGGYLIWRGLHPFIDGRSLRENVFQDYRLILGSEPGDLRRDAALARYGAGAIVLNGFEYNSGVVYPLVFALAQPAESDWKLVYDDAAALVFLRNPPAGMPVLDKSRIAGHLEAECALHVTRDPEFSLCARSLGNLFLRMGDRERALRNFALYLDHPYDNDPRPRQEYLQLLQSK
jgi:hypothetical protein